jgi:hypothetical protein
MKKTGGVLLFLILNGAALFAEGMREEEKQAYCEKLESFIKQGAGKRREELGRIPGLKGNDTPNVEISYSDSTRRDRKLTIRYHLSPTKTYVDYVSIGYTSSLRGTEKDADLDYFFIQAAHFLIYYGAYSRRIEREATGYVYNGEKHTGRLTESASSIRIELDKPADVALFSDPKFAGYIETNW